MREFGSYELAHLKKEEEENQFWQLLVRHFRDVFLQHWESSWPGKRSKMNGKLS